MLAAAASLVLLLATGETIRWTAGVETQARGRKEPAGDGRAGLGELDLRAQLGLAQQTPDVAAALTWSPSLLLRQAITGVPAESGSASRQVGRLELQTLLAPATRLTSRAAIDWGLTDFSPLSGQVTPVGVGLLPSQRFVLTLAAEMMFDLTHAFSRRLHLSAAAGMQRSGGVGHDAVQVLPFQVGPQATASLTWVADRANEIRLFGSASESRFSIGRTSVLYNLETGWTLRASPHTVVDAAAGFTVVHSSATGSSSSGTYGASTVGVAWDLPVAPQRRLRSSLRVRLLPGVDRFTALATQTVRAEGGAELTEGRLRVGASASQGHAISGIGAGADDLRLDARTSWIVARGWSLDGGLGAARTNQSAFTGWQAQALVGLRWADRGSF